MTIAESMAGKLNRGQSVSLLDTDTVFEDDPELSPYPIQVEATTHYIRLTFADMSRMQRVWYQGLRWVVLDE